MRAVESLKVKDGKARKWQQSGVREGLDMLPPPPPSHLLTRGPRQGAINTTNNSQGGGSPGGGMFDAPKIGGFGYGIGISMEILLITTITLASYFCMHQKQPASVNCSSSRPQQQQRRRGIDEATLMNYPKLLYAQFKAAAADHGAKEEDAGNALCCSIFLADYKDTDVLWRLPDCKHLFHLKCVDPWLRLHPTCPVCRTSPLSSPLPTPLAEVVPLARQQP
ncbi:hypothetical protein Taro_033134 [Colocasia esculenta]|uniref:RING-type domain-containing protein n=1 Tax=Colocasia esculenta TaxID=4460 RepID=A0A843VZ96_COLES|nr:hypothetical protein [Colocasia esculenta]